MKRTVKEDERTIWEVDHKSANDVGDLLVRHGIQTVVLNACESAKETKETSSNLARVLVRKGVQTVVAMAYELLETTASIFTQAFYHRLLSPESGYDALSAVRFGRQQLLRRRARKTKFGTQVPVDDYFVPVIYQSREAANREGIKKTLLIGGAGSSATEYADWIESDESDQNNMLIGREADLLSLEMDLYGSIEVDEVPGERKVRVTVGGAVCRRIGGPGVGKTALVETAIRWWKDTGFIGECVWVEPTENANGGIKGTMAVARHLAKKLRKKKYDEDSLDYLLNWILNTIKKRKNEGKWAADKRKPSLFIIGDADNGRHGFEDMPGLKGIIQETSSLAILVSRRTDEWQKEFSLSRPLQPLSRDHAIELVAALVNREAGKGGRKDTRIMTQTKLEAFGNVCKLGFGNPMALCLLAYDFAHSEKDEEEYLLGMMKGHDIKIDNDWLPPESTLTRTKEEQGQPAGDVRRSKSVRELYNFLEQDSSGLAWRMLLPFWFRIPHAELRSYGCWYVESYWDDEDNAPPDRQAEQQQQQESLWGLVPLPSNSEWKDASLMRTFSLMFSTVANFPSDFSAASGAPRTDTINPFVDDDDAQSETSSVSPFADDVDDSDDEQKPTDASTPCSSILNSDDDYNPFMTDDEEESTSQAEIPDNHHPPGTTDLPAFFPPSGFTSAASWLQDALKNIMSTVNAGLSPPPPTAQTGEPTVRTGGIGPQSMLSRIPVAAARDMLQPLRVGPGRREEYKRVWDKLQQIMGELVKCGFATPVGGGGDVDDGYDGKERARTDKEGREDSDPKYYALHPLVPLVLRCAATTPQRVLARDLARDLARRIYPRFITYRIKGWPLGELHAHGAWQRGPVQTVGEEFLNFLAAACLILEQPEGLQEDAKKKEKKNEKRKVSVRWRDNKQEEVPDFGRFGFEEKISQDGEQKEDEDEEVMQDGSAEAMSNPGSGAYARLAQMVQLMLVLQKGILGDRTRHTVVASFWKDAQKTLVEEAAALKRRGRDNHDEGGMLNLAAMRIKEAREMLPEDEWWKPAADISMYIAERFLLFAQLACYAAMMAWRLVRLVIFIRSSSTLEIAQSLVTFASQLVASAKAYITAAVRTNSRVPLLSLASEVVAMMVTCNLCSYYEGVDEKMLRVYLEEARSLKRTRTRIPVLDIVVVRAADLALGLIEGALNPTAAHMQSLLAKRQALYGGLGLLGHDAERYLRLDHGVPGVHAALAAAMDLNNSLSSPYEPGVKVRAESRHILRNDPSPRGVERAEKILQDALDRELHDVSEVTGQGGNRKGLPPGDDARSGSGGALPQNVADLYHELSNVARYGGDRLQAQKYQEEARKWEARRRRI